MCTLIPLQQKAFIARTGIIHYAHIGCMALQQPWLILGAQRAAGPLLHAKLAPPTLTAMYTGRHLQPCSKVIPTSGQAAVFKDIPLCELHAAGLKKGA